MAIKDFDGVEYVSPDILIPYVNNARTHSEEQVTQLAASMREFGFTNPVLIDEENGVLAGHGRLMAAKKLGLKEVPVLRMVGLSEAQKKAYILADNRLAENAGWDMKLVSLELEALKAEDFPIELIGFDLDEIIEVNDVVKEEKDELPEPPVEPVTKEGDIWILGNHRLMCGDSTSFENMDALMEGGKADLYLTDPPYNVAYEGGTEEKLTIMNDEMEDGDFRQFLVDAFTTADSVLKPGGVFYIWHADSEGFNFRGACRDAGWKVRQCLIWNKSSLVLGRQDYQWKHEPCLYGWKDGSHNWYSDRSQTTVLDFDKPSRNGEHPTMKPVELFSYQIGNSTKKGQVVLDSFWGSGTTLVACEQLGRKARIMELDPKYCDVIIRRWQNLTGKEAVRDDGETFNSLE